MVTPGPFSWACGPRRARTPVAPPIDINASKCRTSSKIPLKQTGHHLVLDDGPFRISLTVTSSAGVCPYGYSYDHSAKESAVADNSRRIGCARQHEHQRVSDLVTVPAR